MSDSVGDKRTRRSKIGEYTVASGTPSLYQIEAQLRARLNGPLPGGRAHLRAAPTPRRGWRPNQVPTGGRTAAGLILLYPLRNTPHVLLTVRAGELAQHPGQVSFPGGKIENDETIPQAALREASEEVGVDPEQVRVLGLLSTMYIKGSRYTLHPVVGIVQERPPFNAQAGEVDRLLEVPLSGLLKPCALRHGVSWRGDERIQVPYFELCEERVWGATAMILAELVAILGAGT